MHFLTLFWKVLFALIPPAGKSVILYSLGIDINIFTSLRTNFLLKSFYCLHTLWQKLSIL